MGVTTLTSCRYTLGPVAGIPLGEGRVFQIGERSVAIFRTRAGEVFATQTLCPHRAGPLADGIVGGGKVICPLHGYTFELATGRPLGGACPALQTYPVAVTVTGELVLTLDEALMDSAEARL